MKHSIFSKNKNGTVLFTVISVMMVLIVVMISTLVVVAASQKKSVQNYTNSQSYITARSVADTFTECLIDTSNNDYDDLREKLLNMSVSAKNNIDVSLPKDVTGLGTISSLTVERLSDTKFKVSAAVKNNNSENTVAQIITVTTVQNQDPLFNLAVKSLEGITTSPGFSILGGAACNQGGTNYPNMRGTTGSQFYIGNISTSDSGNDPFGLFNLSAGDSIVAFDGNITINNTLNISSYCTDDSLRPFFYAGGKFILSKSYNNNFGTQTNPIDIICSGASISSDRAVYGNIYSDSGLTLDLVNGGTKFSGKAYIKGSININIGGYSKDNINSKLGGSEIHYSVSNTDIENRIAKHDDVGKALEAIFIKDTNLSALSIYSDERTPDYKMELTLLDKTVNVPTSKSYFDACFKEDDMTLKPGQDFFNTDFSADNKVISNPDPEKYDEFSNAVINTSGILPAGDYKKDVIIDASSGPINLQTTSGIYEGQIIVKGTNKVQIYSPVDVNLYKFQLVTEETANMNGNDYFYTGDQPEAVTKNTPPNIYWYLKGGANMNMDRNGGACVINAYIYGVGNGSTLYMNAEGTPVKVDYSGKNITNSKVSIIGSAVFQNIISTGNNTGILYIGNNNFGGATTQLWKKSYYTNN